HVALHQRQKSRLADHKLQGILGCQGTTRSLGSADSSDVKEGSMTTTPVFRQYAVLRVGERLRSVVMSKRLDAVTDLTTERYRELNPERAPLQPDRVKVVSAPSLDWTLEVVGEHPPMPLPNELTVSYEFDDATSLQEFRTIIRTGSAREINPEEDAVLGIGADPGGALAGHWCPGVANLAVFGCRTDARRALDADALYAASPSEDHPKVNVVVIDEGLNREAIQAVNPNSWGGGWKHKDIRPGSAPRTSHGMLVARNILDIAPHA